MLHSIFRVVGVGIPIGIALIDVVGFVAKVDGISMQPSLNPEHSTSPDFVFLNRWQWKRFDYSRGDVVSLVSPKDPTYVLVKRIIALEGDIVSPLGRNSSRSLVVPKGHCWVEGDHTGHSLDSNIFGPVALGLVQAKASRIVWPPSRMQKLESFIPKGREVEKTSDRHFPDFYF